MKMLGIIEDWLMNIEDLRSEVQFQALAFLLLDFGFLLILVWVCGFQHPANPPPDNVTVGFTTFD